MKILLGFVLVLCLIAIGCSAEDAAPLEDGSVDVTMEASVEGDAVVASDAAVEDAAPVEADMAIVDASEDMILPDQGEDQ